MMKKLLQISEWRGWNVIWGILVFLLPLTSVPFIVNLVHSDVVAAPSALLLPLLMIGFVLPRILKGADFPEGSRPLLLFYVIALIATLVSFFYGIPDTKGKSPLSASLSAVLTLMIGVCFYLAARFWLDSEKKIRMTAQLITISGAVVCLWTIAQACCWYTNFSYPDWMKKIQFFLSVGSLYRQRFVGFTLEPSWLAHQLNLLYLPWWFAASLTGYSAFSFRLFGATVERLLFPIGGIVLFLTLSRVGYAAFLLTALFAALILVRARIRAKTEFIPDKKKRRLIAAAYYGGILIICIAAGIAALWVLTKLDFRMANLFHIDWVGRSDAVFYIAEKLSLAARFVYWDGGFSLFNRFPILGVGLGHAGFYMPDTLNDYALRLMEVRRILFRSDTLLNIKSLWIRILAETGIVGFSCFLVWYLQGFACCVKKAAFSKKLSAAAAWMGCFVLLAFLLEGFSLDTFALPYLWFSTAFSRAALSLDE